MKESKMALCYLIMNYLRACEKRGYLDFDKWCREDPEDDTYNDEEETLICEAQEHVNAISRLLFL